MIAKGAVMVGCPVNADGEAICGDLSAMKGIAGRVSYDRQVYEDGDAFPLVTNKSCLIALAGPCDVTVGGVSYRLLPSEQHYVTISDGKITAIQGKGDRG